MRPRPQLQVQGSYIVSSKADAHTQWYLQASCSKQCICKYVQAGNMPPNGFQNPYLQQQGPKPSPSGPEPRPGPAPGPAPRPAMGPPASRPPGGGRGGSMGPPPPRMGAMGPPPPRTGVQQLMSHTCWGSEKLGAARTGTGPHLPDEKRGAISIEKLGVYASLHRRGRRSLAGCGGQTYDI